MLSRLLIVKMEKNEILRTDISRCICQVMALTQNFLTSILFIKQHKHSTNWHFTLSVGKKKKGEERRERKLKDDHTLECLLCFIQCTSYPFDDPLLLFHIHEKQIKIKKSFRVLTLTNEPITKRITISFINKESYRTNLRVSLLLALWLKREEAL